MVALDILPGVEVWVEVSGQPLQEYEDQGDHPDQENSVTRFIAAESDQYFGIGIQAKDTQGWEGEGLSVQVDIDGSRSKGFLVLKKQLKGKPKRMVNLGLNLPDGKMANYKFSALNLDTDGDDGPSAGASRRLSRVGSIEVRVRSITNVVSKGREPRRTWTVPEGVGAVSEKALKGKTLSHNVQFGDAVGHKPLSENVTTYDFTFMEPNRKPFVTYSFHYRSMEALKSMLIVPRTPSPEPPTPLEERDITTLNAEELKELQTRFLAMRIRLIPFSGT